MSDWSAARAVNPARREPHPRMPNVRATHGSQMPAFYRLIEGRRSIAATMMAAKITERMNPATSE
jgi:hypothetical protein